MKGENLKGDAAAQRVTWIGAAANLLLGVFKFAAGILGNSAAMVADAAHSLSDLVSDVVVLAGLRIAARPADGSHPYGHGKVETSAAVLVGIMVAAAGFIIFYSGARGLYLDEETHPGAIALVAAAVSIVVKELLYRITLGIGRRERRPSVVANAWHHRSDALSSVAALAGIGGEMLGVNHLDQVAALAVALFVIRAGAMIAWDAYKDLVDTAVEDRLRSRIVEVIEGTDGVRSWHKLRSRKVGAAVFVDVHLEVDENLTVRQAHEIADRAENALLERLPVDDVTVHVDVIPCEDKDCADPPAQSS